MLATTLFRYFLIQIKHSYLTKSWFKWLYLPAIAALVIEILVFVNSTSNSYDADFNDLLFHITDNASFVYNAFLIFWSRKLVHSATTISESKKRWLLRLNGFLIGILLMWLLSSIELFLFDSEYASTLLWIGISFLSWCILYYGVFKLQLVVQKDELHQYLVSNKTSQLTAKKKTTGASTSKIILKLFKLMDEEALYKNPLLSRLDLANRLEISEGHLSKTINQEIQKSVSQFVNDYRIETAKTLLHTMAFNKYSVEAIGMEAGFKSKSAFYKSFRKSVGMSPGAYRKLQEKS